MVGAKGVDDSMLVKPISRGFWSLKNFNEKIYSNIEQKSYIVSYGDRYIFVAAKAHNKKILKQTQTENRIRFLSNNLDEWLKCYHGIATKYLEEYLSLFVLFNLDRIIDYIELKK